MRKLFFSKKISFSLILILILFNVGKVKAATTYYISPSGNDSNNGSQTAPFATFSKAISSINAGDTLIVLDGTYNQKIIVSKNGTANEPITIKSQNPHQAIINYSGAEGSNIIINGSYIQIDGFEVQNSDNYCVEIKGSNNTAQNMKVHDCQAHGIYTDGKNINIKNNEVYRATLVNQNRDMPHSWGSGIKVRVGGENILIENNTVYHNYGEGIAVTRGINSTVRGNTVYDNYSVNIYVDNSYNVMVDKNFTYCTPNSGFERDGNPAAAFGMEEESYSGWGAQLHDVTFQNNIAYGCYRGIYYWNSGISGAGMENIYIYHNTFVNMSRYSMAIEGTGIDSHNIVANNIFYQTNGDFGYTEGNKDLTFHHNLYNQTPDSSLVGSGDIYQNPQFTSNPGTNPNLFSINSSSPAINAGAQLNISNDFFDSSRDGNPDIGAIEYQGTTNPPDPSPTPSPTPSPSPSPSFFPSPTPSPNLPIECTYPSDCPSGFQCYQPPFTCASSEYGFDCAQVMPPMICRLEGDANVDGNIDIDDYSILKQEVLRDLDHYQADLNDDEWVDLDDYTILKQRIKLF